MEGIRVILPKTCYKQMRILIPTKLIQVNIRFRPMMLSDLLNIQETHIPPSNRLHRSLLVFSSRFWQTGLHPLYIDDDPSVSYENPHL